MNFVAVEAKTSDVKLHAFSVLICDSSRCDSQQPIWGGHYRRPCATMCYMKVGVRELRQNLSIYLARVIAGEALEVTDRGHAVAVLAPLVRGESVLSRLKREGRVILATAELTTDRKSRRRVSRSTSRELQRDRADRIL
jgi:prevent-host-death family protein